MTAVMGQMGQTRQTYLHHVIAHPPQVSSLGGFLPQQVVRVAAETVWSVQTQGRPSRTTHGIRGPEDVR